MLKERITYKDFNDVERTEDFYFNFTEAEVAEMQLSVDGGLKQRIEQIIAAQSEPELIKIFKKLILEAYGEKSPDGRTFDKSEEISRKFERTNAYSQLFMRLAFNDEEAARWINGVIPKSLADEIAKEAKTISAPKPVN